MKPEYQMWIPAPINFVLSSEMLKIYTLDTSKAWKKFSSYKFLQGAVHDILYRLKTTENFSLKHDCNVDHVDQASSVSLHSKRAAHLIPNKYWFVWYLYSLTLLKWFSAKHYVCFNFDKYFHFCYLLVVSFFEVSDVVTI